MYRLLHPGAAAGAVHAEGEGQLQVQAVAGGGVQPLRVLHHASHRPQHSATDDEGKVCSQFWRAESALFTVIID